MSVSVRDAMYDSGGSLFTSLFYYHHLENNGKLSFSQSPGTGFPFAPAGIRQPEIHCLRHIKEEAKWKKIEGPTYHGIFWIIL